MIMALQVPAASQPRFRSARTGRRHTGWAVPW